VSNHYYSALGSNLNIPLAAGKRWLLSLPLYHVGGLAIIFRTLFSGAATVIADENASIPETIVKNNISHLSLVPTQLLRLTIEHENIAILRALDAILVGGSSTPKALIEQAIQNKLAVYTSYGSTEMSSQITTTCTGDNVDRLYTSGKVLKYRELKIGKDGEILVKGDTLFKGYLANNHIKKNVDEHGWFASGDLGYMNSDNYLTVIGRKDSMFISGGENIYPEEIERQLMQIDGILAARVVDIPDELFGARPVAFIKVKENMSLDIQSIQKSLQEKIARFKIPKHIFNWSEEFNQMKLNQSELRKRALSQLNRTGDNIF
jgi:O-succinylbenzoic acid--CoA ligase